MDGALRMVLVRLIVCAACQCRDHIKPNRNWRVTRTRPANMPLITFLARYGPSIAQVTADIEQESSGNEC
jgi:hypothetical protein